MLLGIPFLLTKIINVDIDVYSRSIMSTFEINLNRDEFFNFNPNRYGPWLPLYFKITGLPLAIYNNVYFTPRFITLLFSAGTVILMYYYAFLITRSANIAWLSSLMFLIFPQRIFLSTLTFSEPIFVFFQLLSLILIFGKRPRWLIGLLSLNIAAGIRYESWFLLPLLYFYIWKSKHLKFKSLLILGAGFFPMFWLLMNWIFTANPVHFLTEKNFLANHFAGTLGYLDFPAAFFQWFIRLSNILTLPGIVLAIFGWFMLVKNQDSLKKHIMILLPFWIFLTLPIQVFLKTMEAYKERYLFIPAAFAFPMIGYGLSRLKFFLDSSGSVKYFPIYHYLILFIGILFIFQLFINQSAAINSANRFYSENGEVLAAQKIIKFRSSGNPSLGVKYYYNQNLNKRLWLEVYIKYFSNFYNIEGASKNELSLNPPTEDIILLERDDNDTSKLTSILSAFDYNLLYSGKLLNIYSN